MVDDNSVQTNPDTSSVFDTPVADSVSTSPSFGESGQSAASFYDYQIIYQMRAATSGSYVLESAVLLEPSTGMAVASPRSTLTIQP